MASNLYFAILKGCGTVVSNKLRTMLWFLVVKVWKYRYLDSKDNWVRQ